MVSLYEGQCREGRWFIHEQPGNATPWALEEIQALQKKTGIHIYAVDRCKDVLTTLGGSTRDEKVAKKSRKFMTNSFEIDMELQKRCDQHPEVLGGRAKWTARYPEDMCMAISRGLLKEIRNGELNVKGILSLRAGDKIYEGESDGKSEGRRREVGHEEVQEAWDDVTGERLDPREVLMARKTEMQYIRSKKVWHKIRRDEAIKKGIKIIKTRWLDINKGDAWNPNHRSRFVGK